MREASQRGDGKGESSEGPANNRTTKLKFDGKSAIEAKHSLQHTLFVNIQREKNCITRERRKFQTVGGFWKRKGRRRSASKTETKKD